MEDELLGPSPITSPHGQISDGIPLAELSETDESPSPVEYDTGDYETGASAHTRPTPSGHSHFAP